MVSLSDVGRERTTNEKEKHIEDAVTYGTKIGRWVVAVSAQWSCLEPDALS